MGVDFTLITNEKVRIGNQSKDILKDKLQRAAVDLTVKYRSFIPLMCTCRAVEYKVGQKFILKFMQ